MFNLVHRKGKRIETEMNNRVALNPTANNELAVESKDYQANDLLNPEWSAEEEVVRTLYCAVLGPMNHKVLNGADLQGEISLPLAPFSLDAAVAPL